MLVAPPVEKYLENEKNLKQIVDDLANELEDDEKIGSNVHIDDSAKFDCRIIPYGNIEQETRKGHNLLDISKIVNGTGNGVTYTLNKGKIILNGITTGSANIFLDENAAFYKVGHLKAGNYTFVIRTSGTSNSGANKTAFYLRNTNLTNTSANKILEYIYNFNTQTMAFSNFTLDAETDIYLQLYANSSELSFTDLVLELMIVEGTQTLETLPEQEQYGAMPSLAFPSPVKHVGGKVKSYNKLENATLRTTDGGVTLTNNENGSFTLNGTSTKSIYIDIGTDITEAGTYKVTFNKNQTISSFGGDVRFILRNGDTSTNIDDTSLINKTNYNVTVEEGNLPTTSYMWLNSGNTFNNATFYPMVYEGTEPKPYLPYGEVGSVYDIAKVNKDVLGWGIQLIDNIGWNASGVKYTTDNTFGTNDLIKVTHDVLTIYDKNYVATSVYGRFNTYDINKNLVSSELIQKMPFTRTFADNEKYYTFHILKEFISYGGSLQTEIGDTATDYTAHQEENRSLDLTNLPLYSKNDYIYKSGDKWFVHNERNQKIIKGTDLANLSFLQAEERTNVVKYNMVDILTNGALVNRDKIITNMFTSIYGSDENIEHIRNAGAEYPNNIVLYVLKDNLSSYDVAGLQELLNNKPLQIVYEITPTETEITDKTVIEVSEALYHNETYKGVTNISTEKNLQDAADLILKIEYKKSNQVKIKELEKEIENLKALILEA